MKMLLKISSLALLATLASCSGGGGGSTGGTVYYPAPSTGGSTTTTSPSTGGSTTTTTPSTGGTTSTYGHYSSPNVLASEFVSSLNSVDGTYSSKVELYSNETLRSQKAGEDDWFVIYDSKFSEYKAVSLQYVRSIVYYDYYSNNRAVASEFRKIENNDIIGGKLNGDTWGDDYEVVDRLSTGYYEGRQSGFLYEDEAGSTDVSLLAKEQDQKKFFAKAAKVSFVYNVSLETSMSMVTLGSKLEKMLSRANGELTQEDQIALMGDMRTLTGVSLQEIQKAATDPAAREDVIAKIADKLGTSASNLEQKLLPEVFGITL